MRSPLDNAISTRHPSNPRILLSHLASNFGSVGNSMGDQFLVGSEAGAVSVLGASTLTSADGERKLGLELNARMYQQGMTIGDAIVQAKQAMAVDNPEATDILLGWQILGDPALVVSP